MRCETQPSGSGACIPRDAEVLIEDFSRARARRRHIGTKRLSPSARGC